MLNACEMLNASGSRKISFTYDMLSNVKNPKFITLEHRKLEIFGNLGIAQEILGFRDFTGNLMNFWRK